IPVAVAGLSPWGPQRTEVKELTPGLIHALRTEVPKGAIVFSDDTTSYRIAAFAPVYVANALPGHVADTKANRPFDRRADAREFFRTGDLKVPRRYGVNWLVVDRARSKLRLGLRPVYRDRQYVI